MKLRWIRMAGAALLLCVLTHTAQAQYRVKFPLPAESIPDGMGVNIHFTDPRPGELEQLAAAGFKWVRQDFFWAEIEKEKERYDFAAYDRLMARLRPFGIRPIFIKTYQETPAFRRGRNGILALRRRVPRFLSESAPAWEL